MASQKIWAAAQRWILRQHTPVETLTPEQVAHRIKCAYVDGHARGMRDGRNASKRSLGNPPPLGSEEL